MKHKDISDAERELFRNSVGPVRHIRAVHTLARKPRVRPIPLPGNDQARAAPRNMTPVPVVDAQLPRGDALYFKRPGIQDTVLEKLRKGKYSVERELDLHGLISTEAEAALDRFLARCRHQHVRCVRIIHGKGRGSMHGKPVIKNRLGQWLRNIPEVLACCPARPRDGGSGAVYVLLKLIA